MPVSLMIRHPAMLHPQHAARAFLVRYGLVDSCVHGRQLRRIERRRDVLRWRCGPARAQPHQEEEGKAERTRDQPARILHHGPHLRATPPRPTTAFLSATAFRAHLATITRVGQTSGLPVRASSGCLFPKPTEPGGSATGRPEVCPTAYALATACPPRRANEPIVALFTAVY